MTVLRWSLLFFSVLLSTLLALAPKWLKPVTPQNTCNFVQNVDSQRVSWHGDLPVHLRVHKSVPPEARPSIERALSMYQQVMGKQMFVIDTWGDEGPDEPQKDGISTIYWMSHWESERYKEQARTTLYWNGEQIYEADIRVNAANFRFNYTENSSTQIDLESLMIHELGHVLGLTHDPTRGSVMNFSLDEGQMRRHIGTVDLASLHCEY